jgi:hypothetical protein
MNFPGSKVSIPMEVHVSNKALSHPATVGSIAKFLAHMESTAKGASAALAADLESFRQVYLDHTDETDAAMTYNKKLGSGEIPVGGTSIETRHYGAKTPIFWA